MLICPNGHEVDGGVAYCRQCGAPLAPQEEPTVVLPLAVTPPAPAARHAAPAVPHTQSNTAVYVLAAVIVVIGLTGIGLALVLGSGSDDSGRPAPVAQDTQSAGGSTPSSSPSSSPRASSTPTDALPAGGSRCPGTVAGGGEFGTIGSETSCGFVQAVYSSYIDTVGLNQSQGQTATVSATSPATHKTYDNIACTVGTSWVTCVGGNNNTARMFFAHP